MPAHEGIQAEIFSGPQEDLRAAVDDARQATGYDPQLYVATHDHFKGAAEMVETIGAHNESGAPMLIKEQHRTDAKSGTPEEGQTHLFVVEDPITGDVRGGGTVTGLDSQGKRFEHPVDTATAQAGITEIAKDVARRAKVARAVHLEMPDTSTGSGT